MNSKARRSQKKSLGQVNSPRQQETEQKKRVVVLTVGHSTRTLDAFLELLKAHGVEKLVDVRTIPRSRRNPQFNRETLPKMLRAAGIGYRHMKTLGGWRRARPDSKNLGWRNASFRGFADYMATQEFEQGLEKLLEIAARRRPLAIMCAEAVPWRCHLSLIADALLARGAAIEHIMSGKRREAHKLTSFACVRAGKLPIPKRKDNRGGRVLGTRPLPFEEYSCD